MTIRVLVVDDEPSVCEHVSTILSATGDLTVVGAAHDGCAALEAVRRLRPDVVLMDARMPGTDGIAATRQISDLPTPPHVVILTSFDDDQVVAGAMRAGAAGFVLKHTAPADLASVVRVAASGHSVMAPRVIGRLTARVGGDPAVLRALGELTDREREVLAQLGAGRSNAQIAELLWLTEATVKGHVSSVLVKLDCQNRTQAALIAFGYLPITPS